VVEGDDGDLLGHARVFERAGQLFLETRVGNRVLLRLDDQSDLVLDELQELSQHRDLLSPPGIQPAELGEGLEADRPLPICGGVEQVVVDDDQLAVERQVDVAFDQVAPQLDR